MKLIINGEAQEVESHATLLNLVVSLGLPVQAVLLEHNGEALRRDEWVGRQLQDGDRLEVIRIVAGG